MKKEKEMLIPEGCPTDSLWRIPARVIFVLLLTIASIAHGIAQTLPYQNSPFGMHPATVNNQYSEALDMGVKWHRPSIYMFWSKVQPDTNNDSYDFRFYDAYYGSVPSGINILANIAADNPKIGTHLLPGSYLPSNKDKYIKFVNAAIERYDGDGINDMPNLNNPITYWQVENEPNNRGQLKDFAELQKITYEAIKSAYAQCKVLIGGAAQPVHPEYGFIADKDEYFQQFSDDYEPYLQELNGKGFDIFDFHWYGNAEGDYKKLGPVYEQMKILLEKYGFENAPVWITEMGAYSGCPSDKKPNGEKIFSCQMESQQAADYLKRFVFSLSLGVKKIFPAFGLIEGFKGNDGYFDHTGFIYDGAGSNDIGLGVKKLSYYCYKKMVEVLEGSSWDSIQTIQESNNIYINKFTKQGKPIWIVWNDSSAEKQISISGINSNQVKITSTIPKYQSGKDVTDYSTAFQMDTLAVVSGSVLLRLGEKPVFVEKLSVEDESVSIPKEFVLYQNYPNPLTPLDNVVRKAKGNRIALSNGVNLTTTIRFSIPQSSHVTLKVFDLLGREVATLVGGELNAGEHSVVFDAKDLPSGVYFYRLQAGNFIQQRKMEVIK